MLSLALVACGASNDAEVTDAARPVTTEESQLLAIVRFNNFDAGTRPFMTTVHERGIDLRLQGWVDYIAHLGYASTTGSFESQALLWTESSIGIADQQPDADGNPVLPAPSLDDAALSLKSMDPSASRLDSLLAVISSLGSDRPDNPLLLQQSGALWLRTDQVDGTPVTVFAAPPTDSPRDASSPPLTADTSPLRLWVNADGVLLRAEARIGDSWSTVEFASESGPDLAVPEGTQQ